MTKSMANSRVAHWLSTACFVGAVLISSAAQSADKIQITIAHLGPPNSPAMLGTLHPMLADFRATGKVETTMYGAGSPYSNPTKYSELVENGVVDMAFGVQSIEKGLFPLNLLFAEPFMVKDIEAGSRAYMKVLATTPELQKEFGENHILQVAVVGPDQLHLRKDIKTVDGLKGLRVQVTAPALIDILREIGASVAVLPRTAIYENLQKGVVDAGMGTWQSMDAFNLYEVTCCHLDWDAVVSPIYLSMNAKKYASLPADVKAVADKWSTMNAAVAFAHVWTVSTAEGKAKSKKLGHKIYSITDEERESLRKRFGHLTEARLNDLEQKGLPAKRIYNSMLEAIALEEKK